MSYPSSSPPGDLPPLQMTLSTNRPLYEEEWFHGVLPREEVVRLLRNEGDFLVRETTRNDESQTVLSVCWNGHKHFIVQTTAEVSSTVVGVRNGVRILNLSDFLGSLPFRGPGLSQYTGVDPAPVPVGTARHRTFRSGPPQASIKGTVGAQQRRCDTAR